ncbi:hypothetical protein MDOR_00650 [Mycolicibacterium doricum]|uniref:Potassium channel domain-containing protein n=1 Tax=Mycolicibacterium doricum TaxID=126673 RepID=A0A7I7VKQ2_9MYCO|nr:potassium channel family protein [Mycolicibacterium doricum]MCV7267655.1 two pore domain potassium channel family protein [Mycolicibacterium doricum]BBZ05896.1 hypothetical protein MDOR_00650 [Mycolicibacterium doricum]
MQWTATVIGIVLVALIVRDVFHTMFHPVGNGSIAPMVMKLNWRLLGQMPPQRRMAGLTGPFGIAMLVLAWGGIAVLGWTLIYWAQMPEGFAYGSELDPNQRHAFLDSLYLSLVTIATLGFGDVVPTSATLRLAAPVEALFGFMLLTAAVSWVLEIYPALHRRRVLALQLSTLRRAREADPGLSIDSVPVDVLTSLAASIVEARNDFNQYSATYYFRDLEADASLAASLVYATQLAAEATASDQAPLRMAGLLMTTAVDSLAEVLDREFLQLGADTHTVVRAYAVDHRHTG